MNPAVFDQILELLAHAPMSFESLHAMARSSGSMWSEEQIRLFLSCMNGVEIERTDDKEVVRIGQLTERDELAAAIIEVVRSFGSRPVHVGEVRQHLPRKFVTTEERIKALAKTLAGLEVFGPGLIRMKN
jgi:hypothetical protein